MAKTMIPITVLLSVLIASTLFVACAGNFIQDVDITWGGGRGKVIDGGNVISLSLDKASGSGFQSKRVYLLGRFDMQMKLVPGNSAGTVTAFYLSSQGPRHDEVDLEFLGNLRGSPYTLRTNIFAQGVGNREQDFRLWFDPTNDFHTYSVVWNPQRIIIFVDNIPVRVFNNENSAGVPFPTNQAMRIYATIWDGEQWATRGGRVKTDWSKAPFTAYFRNFEAQTTDTPGPKPWLNQALDANGRKLLQWVQMNHMIYYYCHDPKRRNKNPECRLGSI